MSARPIVILPDPRLRLVSQPVGEIDDGVRQLARDMLDSMYEARGVGLAAIQIGVARRVVVMDLGRGPEGQDEEEERRREPDPQVLIDPQIVWRSEETRVYEEGCLSIPDYNEEVERPERIRVRYRTLEGEVREVEGGGLFATCVQHEIDHLDGKLFIDHLSRLKRERVVKKFTKLARREDA
jgi:peptide deformylase